MAGNTLLDIKNKTRKITRNPTLQQLSDSDLLQYIDTFILYDFPAELRLFNLRTILTFYTQPGVDQYKTNTTDPTDPLYNFKNKYIAIHPPLFLAGIPGFYTQWRDIFYGYYPQTNTIAQTSVTGNGTPGPFTGTLVGHPMIQNSVNFNCLDPSGEAMILVDYPVSNSLGALGPQGLPQTLPSPYGQINYITGAFTVIFQGNTQNLAPIYVESILYQPGKPIAMLYYDDIFTLRPVPDKVYQVQLEADIRPTELINNSDVPELEQWWQLIAYGAAIKIFQDRAMFDDVQQNMPEYSRQLRMALRTTLVQQANERTTTIFTQGKNYGLGWFGPGGWPY